jgi:hypothetical protein
MQYDYEGRGSNLSHSVGYVVPRREYFISFNFNYFMYASITVRKAWVHLPVEQTERPDHLSFT